MYLLITGEASALELVQHNISTNKHVYSSIDLGARVLDWEAPTLPLETDGKIDIIV